MTKFNVPKMSCGHCTATIQKEIKAADQSAEVSCDLTDRTVAVESSLGADTLLSVIKAAGYEATAA
ncbi:heavy-metal-associated domain-containing protein [Candidatus Halocynthiibacter alkanivorans]|uniref:heavy-metal-associated domain-containing protein n=1 Tax=Candidatus Halocynthiibacter alkanivorans TaxID=2267619 RepID=UPI000DF14E61|nr:heavy-metal-associated domain-containing protein [Candidatus Halocynthiibacter alkanivorans]